MQKYFDLETQNLKVRSITETVLEKSKQKNFKKKLFRARCNIAKIDGPVTFLLYELECYFFLIDVDIGCSLWFKNVFGKYDPAFPKNP